MSQKLYNNNKQLSKKEQTRISKQEKNKIQIEKSKRKIKKAIKKIIGYE